MDFCVRIGCRFVRQVSFYEENDEYGIQVESAKKAALISARPGKIGEEIDTRPRVMKDGKVYVTSETKSKVKVEGSMIVKNPDGEEYIVKPDKFAAKYKETETPGVYQPIAEPIQYIPVVKSIVFVAPWGEEMYAVEGSCFKHFRIRQSLCNPKCCI